jgi:hypothetical protein
MAIKSNGGIVFSTGSERSPRNAAIEKLLKEVFSVQSMPRLYNEEQLRLQESLETAVRRVGVVRQSPANKDVNTEVENSTELKTVTGRQPMKAQKAEKT